MNEKDEVRFLELFTGLCEVKNKKFSQVLLSVYFEALKEYSIEDVEKSIGNSIKLGKYPVIPQPVELIEYITGGSESLEDKAIVQASRVLNAVRQIGGYSSVCFDDPITNAVIKQAFSGWGKLCNDLIEQDEKWFLKDFAKIYQTYSRNNIRHNGRLIGKQEQSNISHGYSVITPEIIYIGDVEKAKLLDLKEEEPDELKKLTGSIGKSI